MRHRIFFFATGLVVSACSTPQGITPIQPELGHYSPTVVESLNPTFRWELVSDPETLYDFAIFEVWSSGQPGKSVYYREGLKQPEHKVEEPLKPNMDYFWSVRPRQGTDIGEWATYDHKLFVPIPFGFYYQGQGHLMFPFKTPPN